MVLAAAEGLQTPRRAASQSRTAHLMSSVVERGNHSSSVLRSCGFSVTVIPPISLAAAKSHLEQIYGKRYPSNLSSIVSNMLTQQQIWRRPARQAKRFVYVFEDDLDLEPWVARHHPTAVQGILDRLERVVTTDLIYLGHSQARSWHVAGPIVPIEGSPTFNAIRGPGWSWQPLRQVNSIKCELVTPASAHPWQHPSAHKPYPSLYNRMIAMMIARKWISGSSV